MFACHRWPPHASLLAPRIPLTRRLRRCLRRFLLRHQPPCHGSLCLQGGVGDPPPCWSHLPLQLRRPAYHRAADSRCLSKPYNPPPPLPPEGRGRLACCCFMVSDSGPLPNNTAMTSVAPEFCTSMIPRGPPGVPGLEPLVVGWWYPFPRPSRRLSVPPSLRGSLPPPMVSLDHFPWFLGGSPFPSPSHCTSPPPGSSGPLGPPLGSRSLCP